MSEYSENKIFHHPDSINALKQGKQPVPVHLQLIISDLCNQDCSFCAFRMSNYINNELFHLTDEKTGKVNNNPNRMISKEKCFEIIDDCKSMGVKAIEISGGGEPLVHPDHLEIFNRVLDNDLDLSLISNATKISPKLMPALLKSKWLRFSFDAARPETYSLIRKVSSKHYDKAWRNVKMLVDEKRQTLSNVTIGVGFVVTKENYFELFDFVKMAKDAGVDNVRISAFFQSEGENYFSEFYKYASEEAIRAEQLQTDSFTVFNNFGKRIEDLRQASPDYSLCGYQHFTCYVGADLNLYRCCVTSYTTNGLIGSLKTQSFKTLWESNEKLQKYKSFDARSCKWCMFNKKNKAILYAINPNPKHVNFV